MALLLFTLYKSKRRRRDLGFFFAVFGLTLIFETIIYVFLKAYEYYPLIIRNSPNDDGVIGNIFSQFSLSSAALFVCVLNIPTYGIVIIGLIFYLIEKLFLALGIYQIHWYRPWFTLVGIIIVFHIVKLWFKKDIKNSSSAIQYLTIMLGVLALYLPTTNWLGILSGFYIIKEDLLIDPFISHAVVVIPKYLFMINMVYFLNKYKADWVWNAVFIAVLLTIDSVLYYTHIMYVKEGWLLIYTGLSLLTTYLYITAMKKLLYS